MDQAFFEFYKSWYSFINQSVNKLSISSDSRYGHQTPQYILSRYANDISTELKSKRSHEHDNKLSTSSYLYNEICLQTYVSFGLSKRITKELTKNRIIPLIYLLNEVDISDRKFHEKNENVTFVRLLTMKKILCFFVLI